MTKVIVDIGCFNARTLSLANKLLHRKKEDWFGLMVDFILVSMGFLIDDLQHKKKSV